MLRRCCSLVFAVSLLVACGSGGEVDAPGPEAFAGPLTVAAASSLTAAFTALQKDLAARSPQLALTLNFAGSQSLARQVEGGAEIDVIASADERAISGLVDRRLVGRPTEFARNRLAIAVAPGNPDGIRSLADLGRAGLVVVLADPAVPLGNYSIEAFRKARVPVPEVKSLELDAVAAVTKVASGEADAAVVYANEIGSARGRVEGVEIPDDQNVVAKYFVSVVESAPHRATAEAFVQQLLSREGQDVLRANGFLPPAR